MLHQWKEKEHKRNLFQGLQTWGEAFWFGTQQEYWEIVAKIYGVSLPDLFCVLDRKQNKKHFPHQVSKLDGGEPGLNEWPQAPKEVRRQGEPAFKDKTLSRTLAVLPWFYSVDTISRTVLTVAIPVDLHVQLLLHLHLVLFVQVAKLWVRLAQVALDEVKLKGKRIYTG